MRTLSSIGLVATRNQPFVRIGFCLVFARLLESARCVEAIVMTTVQPIPVIAGPTAGGKTSLAVEVALRAATGGEVISADSMQVYIGMDIGSAKPPLDERRGVPHHLIDLVDPAAVAAGSPFTVDDWLPRADEAVRAIQGRGRLAIVAGGTNLYIKAFLEGLFEGPPPDAALRDRLSKLDASALRADLERIDPAAAERIHPNDRRRTIRALEVYEQTGMPISEHQRQWDQGRTRPGARLFVLEWPTELINRRINRRVRIMMEDGLLDEVRRLRAAGAMAGQPAEALGYKQLLAHLGGEITLDEAVERIKIETRRFAKNQRTWLRRLAATPGAVILRPDQCGAEPAGELAERVLAALGPLGA
jgi:tRNA dimethylallyltransferase